MYNILIVNVYYKIKLEIALNNLYNLLLANGFLSFLTKFSTIILAVVILLLMITIHELGHYFFGKILKFKINEFSIGFGKAIFSKTNKSGEKVSLRVVPLGGYCAFEGEDENSNNPQAFNNQAPWKRLIVLFGGVLFNFLSAIIFSVFLLTVIGDGTPKITKIYEPSMNTGIEVGDVILEINGQEPNFLTKQFSLLIDKVPVNTNITLTILRNGEKEEILIQKRYYVLNENGKLERDENDNFIIVSEDFAGDKVEWTGLEFNYQNYSFGESLLRAVPFTFEMAWECIVIIGQIFTGHYGLKDLGGPITTINLIAEASAISLLNLLLLIPLIAVNLAVFNLLPIPALDGARMVFVLIEWIRKKPINREVENKIHFIGLMVLLSFVILIDLLQILVF